MEESGRLLRILAKTDTEGIINLLEHIQSKVFRIIEKEADIHGDSEVLVGLDNLFDYLGEEIEMEKMILNSINKQIKEANHDTL